MGFALDGNKGQPTFRVDRIIFEEKKGQYYKQPTVPAESVASTHSAQSSTSETFLPVPTIAHHKEEYGRRSFYNFYNQYGLSAMEKTFDAIASADNIPQGLRADMLNKFAKHIRSCSLVMKDETKDDKDYVTIANSVRGFLLALGSGGSRKQPLQQAFDIVVTASCFKTDLSVRRLASLLSINEKSISKHIIKNSDNAMQIDEEVQGDECREASAVCMRTDTDYRRYERVVHKR